MASSLDRLTPVELRDQWQDEAANFTPWLAEPANLNLLAETLGISLDTEDVQTEVAVGPYKADVVVTTSEGKVVIENQLEETDHEHLGKALTYAASLGATTVIWIAQKFTEEHRQAIDWLNESATQKLQVFGVEVQLWKIGTSAPAPMFRIVAKPNNYVRAIQEKEAVRAQLKGAGAIYYDFWTRFREYLAKEDSFLRPNRPLAQNWLPISIGRSNFSISLNLSVQKRYLGCELDLWGPVAYKAFELLSAQKEAIESQLGSLNWMSRGSGVTYYISLYLMNQDVQNQSDWPKYFTWLKERAESFYYTFRPKVLELDLTTESGQ